MRKPKSQSGGAAMEVVLLFPVLCVMLLGAIDFGRVTYDIETVSNAARAGVSHGSLNMAKSKQIDEIKQVAINEARDIRDAGVAVKRFGGCENGNPVDCDDTCAEGAPRCYVQVTVQKTFRTLIDYPGIPDTVNIRRQAIMRAR